MSCNGQTDGFINITTTGGTQVYTYDWTDQDGNAVTANDQGNLENIGAGTYTAVVTDENGCSDTVTVEITENEPVAVSEVHSDYTGFGVSCKNETDGFINLTTTGGTQVYTYDWTDQDGNAVTANDQGNLENIGAGTYTAVVTDENGCSDTVTVEITEPTIGVEVTEEHSDYTGAGVSCNGQTDGFINLTATGGTETYTYDWTDQDGNTVTANEQGNLENIGAGTYTVVVTDENGCSDTVTVEITENEVLEISENTPSLFTNSGVSCNGQTDGFINITTTGGTQVYTYDWTDQDGNAVTANDQGNLENIGAGTYTAVVTDENGCSDTVTVEITENEPVAVSEVHSDYAGYGVSCKNETDGFINLTTTGGTQVYTYDWTDQDGNAVTANDQGNLENIGAGTYTAVVTDENGCSDTVTVEITEPTIGVEVTEEHSDYTGAGVSCNGQTDGFINITTTGGTETYTYDWTDQDGNTVTANEQGNLENIGAGTYTAVVTDENGCSDTVTVEITENEPISISEEPSDYTGSGVSCNGQTDGFINITTTGGTQVYTYDWTDQDGNAVTANDQGNLENIGAGTYTAVVTDENGCSDTVTVEITENEPVAVSEVHSDYAGYGVSCKNETDGFINLTTTGGTQVYTYDWTDQDGNAVTANDQGNLENIGAGTYTAVVTDENGCSDTVTVEITEPTIGVEVTEEHSDYTGAGVSCNGETDGFINLTATGGTETYTYDWTDQDGNTVTANEQGNLENIGAGTYTAVVTDENGCSDTVTVEITENEPISISEEPSDYTGSGVSCNGQTDGFINVTTTGGTQVYTYDWTDQDGNAVTANDQGNLENIGAGTYTAVVTDENGCSDTVTVEITENEPVAVSEVHSDYTGYGVSCKNETDGFINLTTTGGTQVYTYDWTDQDGNAVTANDQGNLENIGAGTYTAVVTDENGCSDTVTVEITEPTIGVEVTEEHSDYTGAGVSCNGETDGFINLTATGGTETYTYDWTDQDGNTVTANEQGNLENIGAGTYTAVVTDENGCSDTVTVEITENEPISISEEPSDYTGSGVSCNGQTDGFINVTTTGGTQVYTYDWTDQDGNAVTANDQGNLENIGAGTYTAVVTDENGCSDTVTVEITENEPVAVSEVHSDYAGYGVSCKNETDGFINLTTTGGTQVYTYDWTDQDGNAVTANDQGNLENIGAGTYTAVVTDENGCSDTVTVEITEPTIGVEVTEEHSDYTGAGVSCNGQTDGFINLTATGGTETYTYDWTDQDGNTVTANEQGNGGN